MAPFGFPFEFFGALEQPVTAASIIPIIKVAMSVETNEKEGTMLEKLQRRCQAAYSDLLFFSSIHLEKYLVLRCILS